jgi:hypothetical protein
LFGAYAELLSARTRVGGKTISTSVPSFKALLT